MSLPNSFSTSRTLLLRACLNSPMDKAQNALVQQLLEEGQDPNLMVRVTLTQEKSNQEVTTQLSLLSFAVLTRNLNLVTTLLDKGANPNTQDPVLFKTPLHWAMMQQVLIQSGKSTFQSHEAFPDVAWMLLQAGADPTLQDHTGALYSDALSIWDRAKWDFRLHQRKTPMVT